MAYTLRPATQELAPSPRQRNWMPHSAKVCLPLLVANQSGWVLSNPHTFTATWDGGEGRDAVTIDHGGYGKPTVSSHFGGGIITWSVDYLFRTPPGWNLWVRGPVNMPKDGAAPLEGVVETDWADFTFTMNWRLTRPGLPVTFDEGEPFCMIVPQARGELESFDPRIAELSDDPEVEARYKELRSRRDELQVRKFIAEHVPELRSVHAEWEGSYFHGTPPGRAKVEEHQMRLKLGSFERE